MSEQTQQPTEAQTSTETTPQAPQSTEHPTLEQVYKDFNVQLPNQQQGQPAPYQPAPQQPQEQPRALEFPDPIQNPDGFKSWMHEQARVQSMLLQSNQQASGLLQQLTQAQTQAALQKDISSAVDTVNQTLNLAEPQKKLIEFALEHKARSDPRFLQIWNNRNQNPIAWSRALNAVTGELGETFSVKVDPQLREDRQALRTSQQASAVTRNTHEPEYAPGALAPAGSPEFERWWNGQIRTHQ